MRRLNCLVTVTVLTAAIGLTAVDTAAARQAPTTSVSTDQDPQPIGPGTTLSTFSQVDQGIALHGNVIEANLTDPRLTVNPLTPPHVGEARTVTQMATAQHAIAGVNGDFFDIDNTGAPKGIEISGGRLLKGPQAGPSPWRNSVGVDTDRVGRIVDAYLDGSVVLPAGKYKLDGLNQEQVPATGGLDVFTPLWGTTSRAIHGASSVHEVTVVNGRVTAHSPTSGSGAIPAGGFVLAGTGTDVDLLAALKIGDPVSVSYGPRTEPGHKFGALIGARDVIVRAGQLQNVDDTAINPETAIGFSQDGRKMWLVVIDGRTAASRGVTERQMGLLMQQRGAYDAVIMDGGGSSEMVSRDAGGTGVTVRNVPSDGVERPVGNGIGLFSAPGSGHLNGLRLSNADPVFTGLHRTLSATGYDETYGPADTGRLHWSGADRDGVVTGGSPGAKTVTVSARGVHAQEKVSVLPALNRITVPQGEVDVVAGQPGTFSVTGYDATGESAPIDPSDVCLEYDHALVDIRPTANGTFSVRPRTSAGTGVVTVHVGDRVTTVGVAIGLVAKQVTGFEDASSWKFAATRATGSSAAVDGALRMSFDFSKSDQTRVAVVRPPAALPVPGRAHAFDLSVNGDGKGEWLAVTVKDATGKSYSLYGDYVTWTGWRRTSFAVPARVTYPITVTGVEAIEAKWSGRYTGQLDFDDLAARVSPAISSAGRRTPAA